MRPGDRETVLGFMYPIYVSAELKTKKIAVIATLAYVQIHLCMLGFFWELLSQFIRENEKVINFMLKPK